MAEIRTTIHISQDTADPWLITVVELEEFNKFSHFSVASMQEVINELDYQENRQIPDHSLLSWQIHLDQAEESQPHSHNLDGQQPPTPTVLVAHYNLQNIPQNFMKDRYQEVKQLIKCNVLNTNLVSQDHIGNIYSQFCSIIKNEMDDKPTTCKPRKHTHTKKKHFINPGETRS